MTKKTSIAAVAIVAALALPMVAGAENKLVVKADDGVTDAAVITSTGYLGLGSGSPGGPILAVSSGNTLESAGATFKHTATGTPITGAAPNFSLYRNNPLNINSGLPRKNDSVGNFVFGTLLDSVAKNLSSITAIAENDFTSTAMPTLLRFATTEGTNFTERMRISAAGNVGIGATVPTQKLQVNGGIRLSTATAKPACAFATRGTIWFTQGGTGVADTLEVCSRDAAAAYAWRSMITP
jgi:hypothetical protein